MALTRCTHCGDDAQSRCAKCKAVVYCSKDCQKADWHWHKLLCGQTASFLKKPEGDQEVRRVIVLPQDGTQPRFYWMPVTFSEGDEEQFEDQPAGVAQEYGVPKSDNVLGSVLPTDDIASATGITAPEYLPVVLGKTGSGEHLDHGIFMMQEGEGFVGPNLCLSGLFHTNRVQFGGPIVLVRMTKVARSAFMLDIEVSDFTQALDGIWAASQMLANPIKFMIDGFQQPRRVNAVKVNAGIPRYEETRILAKSKFYAGEGRTSALSIKAHPPLMTATAPTTTQNALTDTSSAEPAVLPSTYLHIIIDPASPDFGTIPSDIKASTTSTLVYVAEKKTHAEHKTIIAFCDFVKDHAYPMLLAAKDGTAQERKAAVKASVKLWDQVSGIQKLKLPNGKVAGSAHDDDSDADSEGEEGV